MKSLVLAEKPSVARDLARVLGCTNKQKHYIEGPRYIITWALGHLIELKMPEDYNPRYKTWRLEDLPIIPDQMDLKVIRQTSAQFKGIEQLAKRKDINQLIIATDAGREGELVARWIMKKIRWKKPVKRLWISSQTDRAIQAGFKQLKHAKQYDKLYESAVCRAEADWLIGLNVTRALTTKYDDPLSAGRVQTPTLAMILEREKEIQSFVPNQYWTLHANIGSFESVWIHHDDRRLFSDKKANSLFRQLKDAQQATVTSVQRKKKKEPQPLQYDLTELQRDANRRFGFSAKKTANVLQRLYEYKLVTYPRTDSRYLTTDIAQTMGDRLQALYAMYKEEVQPILKQKGKVLANRVFDNKKVTDHHASATR